MMMPSQDAVVAITAATGNMQGELDALWEHLLPAFQSKALPADSDSEEKLKQAVASLVAHPKRLQEIS